MNKLSLYTLLLAGLLSFANAMAQQKEYKGRMKVTPVQLEQVGDSLRVGIDFNTEGVYVDSRRSISLIPTLIAPGMEKKLPEVMVKGRANYLTSKRELALMNKTQRNLYEQNSPYAIIKGYKSSEPKQFSYRKTIVFEPWMKDARLDIQEDLCGCGNKPRSLAVSQLVNHVQIAVPPYEITPSLAYVKPEAAGERKLAGDAFLDFVVSEIDILSDYMNNPVELKKITDMMEEVRNDKTITVKSISVVGYASPEGPLKFNKHLSEARANALIEYLLLRFDYPREMYRVEFRGENWAGLKEAVAGSDMAEKQELLAIIGNKQINRKAAIFAIKDGDVYRYMLKKYYPSLRKAVCRIDYEVKGFDVEKAKEVLKTDPQDLSLNEMYRIANTYEAGSPEFTDVFETAVRIFPEDETANLNAASAALFRGDTATAERYLGKVRTRVRIPEYDNAVGVMEMLKGNYDKAETSFEAAIDAGLESARKNLDELQKKRENIELLNKENR